MSKPLTFPSCSPFLSKAKQNSFCGWHSPVHFWQHECQTPGIWEACKANTQCGNYLRGCCGWLCREAQGWPQRTESHFLQCQLWHCSLYHCRATVVQSNFGEKKKDQMLHLGHEDGTDWFWSLFQTKGMGKAESQRSDRVAKGKRAMLEEPSLRREWGGDRSSCWLADGEHLQHWEAAARTSTGWKARG